MHSHCHSTGATDVTVSHVQFTDIFALILPIKTVSYDIIFRKYHVQRTIYKNAIKEIKKIFNINLYANNLIIIQYDNI